MPVDAYAPESMRGLSLDLVEKEVEDGLPGDRSRLERAIKADDYYQLRNEKHVNDYRRPDEDQADFDRRPKEFSWVTQAVVDKLSEPLYEPGPTRVWEDNPQINTWLQGVVADAKLNVRMASADRSAMLGHVSAIQIEATGDVQRPIRYWLWKPHEFVVFLQDGDPTTPWAVCTIEQMPAPTNRGMLVTRYKLWSAWERRVYISEPYDLGVSWGQRAKRVNDEMNGETPYPGVLPFSFVRNKPADSAFWEGGIGDALVTMNQSIDRKISNLSHHVDLFLNPLPVAKNLPAGHMITIKPGKPITLPSMRGNKVGDTRLIPELSYLQPSLNVEAGWYHVRSFSDSQMEELQIPLTIVRNDSSTDLSGVAIMYKTVPITRFIKARQPRYSEMEIEVAAKSLAVSAAWYGTPGHEEAARDPKLMLFWPEPVIPQPTPERNEADKWEMEQGLSDPISIHARRAGLTIDEAIEQAKETAKRWKIWNSIMEGAKPEPKAQEGGADSKGKDTDADAGAIDEQQDDSGDTNESAGG